MRLTFFFLLFLIASFVVAQPTITGFSPVSGPVGTMVTISGSNFSTIPANNIVDFGAVRADVVSASASSLQVTVPFGATYEPITITTNNLTAYSIQPFIITFQGCGTLSSASFSAPIYFQSNPIFSYAPTIEDLDNDGKPDILYGNYSFGLNIYQNISLPGNISFAPAYQLAMNTRPLFVDLGDIDGDGEADIVSSQENFNSGVSVARNTSTPGTFSFSNNINYATATPTLGIRTGDLDGDGKPDIAAVSPGVDNYVYLFQNVSSPGLISLAPLTPLVAAHLPYNILIYDLDDDNKPELIVSNADDSSVSVYKNTSVPGSISFAPRIDMRSGVSPRGIACGDIDGDGKTDIIVCNAQSNTLSVYVNTSMPGNVSFLPQMTIGAGTYPNNITMTDMNGDGKPDIIVTNTVSQNLLLFQNFSTQGNVILSPAIDYYTGQSNFPIAAGDLDGDGKPNMTSIIDGLPVAFRNLITLGPKVRTDSTAATCNNNNGTITVTGSGGVAPLQYSVGGNSFQSSGNFNGLAANTYKIKVKDGNGCIDSTTVIIKQTGNPSITATSINASCTANDGTITATATGGVGTYTFSRDDIIFQTGNVFNNLGPRLYNISVKDSAGCLSDTAITILANCVSISAIASPDTCEKSKGQINASATVGIAPYQFSKDGVNFQSSGMFSGLPAGTYTITVKDATKASATTIVSVDNFGVPVTVNAGNDAQICEGDKTQLHAISDGGSVMWSPTISLDNPDILDPSASPDVTTTYIITATNGTCMAMDSVTVFVNPKPQAFAGNDTSTFKNQSLQLRGIDLNNAGSATYSWSPPSGLNNSTIASPIAVVDKDITYLFTITTASGCKSTDNIAITIFDQAEIYVPNAFTPNSDGLNDILNAKPVGLKQFNYFKVFDRQGEMIFSTTNARKGWEGTFRSKPQQAGVYVWIAEGVLFTGEIIKRKGIVTLIR